MNSVVDIAGKRILFVGGEAGLDRVLNARLHELGAEVVRYGGTSLDVVVSEIKEIVKQQGVFDGMVYAVVHSDFKPLSFVTPEHVQELMNDNYGLFVEVMRALKKSKGLKQGASVVAISSISSFRAMKAKMAFCSAKAALDIAVKCLAAELADKGIRLNSIQKGGCDVDFEKSHIQDANALNGGATEQRQPLGLVKAEEIANMAAFLLSDATTTMTGANMVMDGGYTL